MPSHHWMDYYVFLPIGGNVRHLVRNGFIGTLKHTHNNGKERGTHHKRGRQGIS